MRRVLALATLAVCAASCSGGKSDVASLSEVLRVLNAAHLEPQRVKLVTTIAKQDAPPPGPVNYCAAEAVGQAFATSLDVEHGRAIVIVFETRRDADAWTPLPECGARPLRVANVIAVATHGHLSRRLQAALQRLH
jgi:hypothetical protein